MASPSVSPAPLLRVGVHTSVAGGVETAAQRAHELGATALQIFSSSPRQWRAAAIPATSCDAMRRLRAAYNLGPLVIHDNYLINLAAAKPDVHAKSMAAFRGELERAVALGAEYLVMHPGSSTGGDHGEAKQRFVESVRRCAEGLDWGSLTLLIENTAGGGSHLGGTFEEVAELIDGLAGLPVGACIDTCHTWVAGYDLVTPAGYEATLQQLDATVGLSRVHVFHVNDAKAGLGSRLDRHEHIGKGQLGDAVFARLLRDPRCQGKAFIAETPVDEEGDERRNLDRLRALAEGE